MQLRQMRGLLLGPGDRARLRPNALVSGDLANFLVGYTEVTRWGNAERRVLCLSVIKTSY